MPGGALMVGEALLGTVGANRGVVGIAAAAVGSATGLPGVTGVESVGRIRAEAFVVVEDIFQMVMLMIARINKASKIIRGVLYSLDGLGLAGFLVFGIKLSFRATMTSDGHYRNAQMVTPNSQSTVALP